MDEESWDRVRALEGAVLRVPRGSWFRVEAVGAHAVGIRAGAGQAPSVVTRRTFEAALPYVAAGRPLPPRLRARGARAAAILRAAGAGPGAQPPGPCGATARPATGGLAEAGLPSPGSAQ